MASASNLSSTRRTVRALRQSERLTESTVALATLALTTARALDDVVASDEKRYVVAQLSRAHLLALEALTSIERLAPPDAVDELLASLTAATAGSSWDEDRL